ncbi:uncharacterized protein N7529_003680 [Penicillium soppii]|uniref:uncharacterized protein n=1 Tax=Penicillium soppii TaxID=69789 RepID=UPI0025478A2E|nr:uncharacterized protein N7529_003680 [Penicillium soppii]KAJ5871327.1 hypothetical protein N7529_003680 [Penicillium soppii]
MGHRDTIPVHVPLRTSSRNPSRNGPTESQENLGASDRKISKAQRFFGTDITLPQEHSGWQEAQKTRQPSYIKPTSSAPRQSPGFVPFPSSSDTLPNPDHNLNLRVRASSPLLGQEYKLHENAPPLLKHSKKVHHTGSSSNLFSYFSSKESKEAKIAAKTQALQPRVRHGLGIDPQVTFQAPEPPKESKRKMRPPRIDLSVLFPKPRHPAPQTLLSPQRMVNSPSSVSTAVTEDPSNKLDRIKSTTSDANSRRYVDPHPRRPSVTKVDPRKHGVDDSDLPSIAETRNSGWLDQPLERTVGTSEIDLALDRYAGRRSLFSRSSVYTESPEKLQPEQQRPQDPRKSSRRPRTPSSQPREMYLSPSSHPDSARARGNSTSQESWKTSESKPKSQKSSATKKTSRSTLKNKDLLNTSILCLSSSSEDEDEDRTPTTEPTRKESKFRDSVGTYDESEPEIYTAATAKATTATAAKRFDRAQSTGSRSSRQVEQSQLAAPVPRPRKVSQSSSHNSKTSQATKRTTQTRRSSGVPAIPEPDILSQFPKQPLRSPAELKEMNRRSRYIAVTRQEQDLLEAMRVRKGKVTPSLFNAVGADRQSVISGPSRDSFCESDTSFLRLSNVFPPFDAQSLKSTAQYKDGIASSGSYYEHKAGTAISSPGFSNADYSESLPSPATSGASPLTPTLPIHRFSPLPSPKPPPRGPPPAIPGDQKQHTRRRTDSSEAIMIDDSGEPTRNHGLPLWSFDFGPNITTVH